ncbi:DNA repair protein rad50 [Apophysomyces sp. BC1034]|nr:DNA repair protein rad50 [Apophysomyces sp. BC1021]KAG0194928.1 DNA repair protein rad50 [Apophysomyces sp. BC1034]
MSSIEALAILGIRSFSPEEPQYITFLSPFTLIVGPNGSGKTASVPELRDSIIECLKYACTGDLPPNSRNGAFIHDPKVAGVSEVKAQVKLKFANVNRQPMICSRSLSLTQKRTTVQQKTLDNTLQRRDPTTGEVVSVSSRCVDMDAELPMHLGVPRAILDNVVFCHQEQSTWPLSEPSVLKKKFDDIFESTRYTKALQNMKELRKKRAEDVRVDQVTLDSITVDTKKAKKVKRTVEELENRMNTRRAEAERLEIQLEETAKEIKSLEGIYKQAEALESQLAQIEHERKVMDRNMEEMAKTLTERNESEDELRGLLKSLKERSLVDEEVKQDLEYELTRLKRKIQNGRDKIASMLTNVGRLQAEADANEQRKQERLKMIKLASEQLKLELSPSYDVDQSVHMLQDFVKAKEEEYEQIKLEARKEQQDFTGELQHLKAERATLDETQKQTKFQMEDTKKMIRQITDQLTDIQITRTDLKLATERFTKEENTLIDLKSRMSSANITSQLAQKERVLRDLDDQINGLNDEMSNLSRQGDSRAKLALKRTDRERKIIIIQGLFEEYKGEITSHLGRPPSLESLESDIAVLLSERNASLRKAQDAQDYINREIVSLDAKLSVAQQTLAKNQGEVDKYERSIQALCGNERLPDLVEKTDQDLQNYRDKIAGLEAAELMYKRFNRRANADENCPLCSRQFLEENELQSFLKKLESTMAKIPAQMTDLKNLRSECELRQLKLKELDGPWERMQKLQQNDLVALSKSIDDYIQDKNTLSRKNEMANENAMKLEKEKKRLEWLLKQSEDVSRQQLEVKQLDDDIDCLEKELGRTGSIRTMTDCQREREDLSDQCKIVRRDIKRLQDDRELSMRELQLSENAVRDAREAVTNMKYKMETREKLEKNLEEAENKLRNQRQNIREFDDKLSPFGDRIKRVSAQLEQLHSQWQVKQDVAQRVANQARHNFERLDLLNKQISEFTIGLKSNTLQNIMNQKEQLESQINAMLKDCDGTEKKIRDIEKDMNDRRGSEREINDQIRYRTMQRQLKTYEQDLTKLRAQRSQLDSASCESKLQQLRATHSELIYSHGGLHNEFEQMQEQIERYQHELDTDYRDIEQRHYRQRIKVMLNDLSITDLDKYSKALENAVMRYHSLKMEDLNKIIRDLWVNTYHGGDIDYIEIRSDNEGSASNRSFNYRVVMVKNGRELDMRGRCSAGQKMLSSILIRLALAETFCINCGILTLDEPTTNLDQDTVENLAISVGRLLQSRQGQRNFQLIVITHDEKFVEYLAHAGTVEQYYRVSKNERYHSVIKLNNAQQQ